MWLTELCEHVSSHGASTSTDPIPPTMECPAACPSHVAGEAARERAGEGTMSRQQQLIERWFSERARPGEVFTGWGVLAQYPGNPAHSSARGETRRRYVEALGLDPHARLLAGHAHPFGAVSTQRLVLGRQGGFRFTPKEELLSLERTSFQLLWWDEQRPGPDERQLVLRVADGSWWDTSSVRHDNHNSDSFIGALGDNAVHVEH